MIFVKNQYMATSTRNKIKDVFLPTFNAQVVNRRTGAVFYVGISGYNSSAAAEGEAITYLETYAKKGKAQAEEAVWDYRNQNRIAIPAYSIVEAKRLGAIGYGIADDRQVEAAKFAAIAAELGNNAAAAAVADDRKKTGKGRP